MTAFYLAGKISKNDWRHEIVNGLRGSVYEPMQENWPILPGAIRGWADYTGPYALSCDHGCYHAAGDHGVSIGDNEGCSGPSIPRDRLVSLCLNAIKAADIVFAWVEEDDCYGTLCEVGYAAGHGVKVVTASRDPSLYPFQEWHEDMWFVRHLSTITHLYADTPAEAFNRLSLAAYRHSLLNSVESPIEKMFLEAVIELAPPELARLQVAHKVASYRLDFALPEINLGIELDGYEYHSSKDAFTKDRQRERYLRSIGWDIIRFSGSEIHRDVKQCVDETVERARSIQQHMERPFGGPAAEARRRIQARHSGTTVS